MYTNCDLILSVKEAEDREKWLAVRNQGIGGSDASVIMGLNPYKSAYQLWLEKRGIAEPEDLTGNPYIYWGHKNEANIADWFQEETGKKIRRLGTIQNRKKPFMIANVDRMVTGEDAGLEIKTAGVSQYKKWKDDEIPDSYYCQCLHYMAVTGADYWYIAVLLGGNDAKWKKIERNEEDIRALIDEETKFWEMVETNRPPEIDATVSCANALKMKYKGNPGSETMLPKEAEKIIKALDMDNEAEKALKISIQFKKNKLMEMMGDFEVGRIGDRKVTWKTTKGRESISLAKVKKEDEGSYEALKAAGLITVGQPSRILKVW